MLALLRHAVLLLAGGVPFALGPVQEMGSEVSQVLCSKCEGEGHLEADCDLCGGEGEHPCPVCASFEGIRDTPRTWAETWTPTRVLRHHGDRLVADLQWLNESFGKALWDSAGSGRAPRATKRSEGRLLCPANCRGGKLLHVRSWVDCKLCTGGTFRCDTCRKGVVECAPCRGEGRARVPCWDCEGLGRVPDPMALAIETCPWCHDTERRACGRCGPDGHELRTCATCLAQEHPACRKCKGIEHVPCPQCGGRGRFGRNKERCKDCRQRGYLRCDECEKGRADCAACGGKGRVSGPCRQCGGGREHPCDGCRLGAYAAWESAALWCAASGEAERSRALWAEARRRCEARYRAFDAQALVQQVGPKAGLDLEEIRRLVDEELADELERLRLAEVDARAD